MQKEVFDPVRAEEREANLLSNKGVTFEVPKRSLLRFFGKPERSFRITEPFLGTLDALSAQYLKMDYTESFIHNKDLAAAANEVKRQAGINSKRCARVVAIAYLNSHFGVTFLTPFYTRYFFWRLSSEKLYQLAHQILDISNLGDFINSIRLLAIQARTTAPLIENQGADLEDVA